MYLAELVRAALVPTPAPGYRDALWFIYQINPLNALLTAYRKILLSPFGTFEFRPGIPVADAPLNYEHLGIAALISVALAIVGYWFFNKRKWLFAEML